jgi:hypothetical protein
VATRPGVVGDVEDAAAGGHPADALEHEQTVAPAGQHTRHRQTGRDELLVRLHDRCDPVRTDDLQEQGALGGVDAHDRALAGPVRRHGEHRVGDGHAERGQQLGDGVAVGDLRQHRQAGVVRVRPHRHRVARRRIGDDRAVLVVGAAGVDVGQDRGALAVAVHRVDLVAVQVAVARGLDGVRPRGHHGGPGAGEGLRDDALMVGPHGISQPCRAGFVAFVRGSARGRWLPWSV